MEKKKYTYEQLVKVLKDTNPVSGDSDTLTEAILKEISKFPAPKRKENKFLSIAGWVSGIAAAILVCLFIGETFFYVPSNRVKIENTEVRILSSVKNKKIENVISKEKPIHYMTFSEKSEMLREYIETRKASKDKYEKLNNLKRNNSKF